MTFPLTFDAGFFPILASELPLMVSLNQVSEYFPMHRHDFMEFSLVLEGQGTESVNGVAHAMTPGMMTVILPYQFHEIRNKGASPLRLLNCMFGLELLQAADADQRLTKALLFAGAEKPAAFLLDAKAAVSVRRLFHELLDEFKGTTPLRPLMLRVKLIELLVWIERCRPAVSPRDEAKVSGFHPLAGQVLHYLTLHYREELSLAKLAGELHLSQVHLSALLKRHTGKTFVELLHEIRLRQACALLVSTDMPAADAGLEAGFQSAATFFRVFKRYKGMTPSEFRSLHASSAD